MRVVIFIFALIVSQFAYSQNLDLRVSITNIKNIKGVIKIGLFNDESTFPNKGEEYLTIKVDVKQSSHTILISDIPKGDYAVSIFHDENTDDECNTNFIGLPKESYGFSNNYRPRFRTPTYDDCKIGLLNDTTIVIELH